MTTTALLIFPEDFKKRSFLDWITAHISGALPPHRYKGLLETTSRSLKFEGTDVKTKENVDFLFNKKDISEVYHGYDRTYHIFQTRGLGLFWKPVKLKIEADGKAYFVYIVTGYEKYLTSNREFYTFLRQWLA